MRTLITPDRKVIVLRDDGTWAYARPAGSVLERWKSLAIRQDLVDLFRGVFERLGVRIVDTGEAVTCIHRGDRIEFVAGVDEAAVDSRVEIYAYQADRLAEQIEKGTLDEVERFRIARELFAGAAGASSSVLQNPLSSNILFRRVIRAKNLIHVSLTSPDPAQEPDATFTLLHVNGRSLVVPGLHGTPDRVFRVSVADALEVQRGLLAGLKAGGWGKWLKLANWYLDWRKKVEVHA